MIRPRRTGLFRLSPRREWAWRGGPGMPAGDWLWVDAPQIPGHLRWPQLPGPRCCQLTSHGSPLAPDRRFWGVSTASPSPHAWLCDMPGSVIAETPSSLWQLRGPVPISSPPALGTLPLPALRPLLRPCPLPRHPPPFACLDLLRQKGDGMSFCVCWVPSSFLGTSVPALDVGESPGRAALSGTDGGVALSNTSNLSPPLWF